MDFTQTLYFRIVEGKITFAANELIEVLDGADAERLSLCAVCRRIFWAKKTEAETCRQKCSKSLYNQRRSDKLRAKTAEAKRLRDLANNRDFSSE
jgi:hypothetical protein